MNSTYEVVISPLSGCENIKRTDPDGQVYWIPKDEANSDYQAYLKSVYDAGLAGNGVTP